MYANGANYDVVGCRHGLFEKPLDQCRHKQSTGQKAHIQRQLQKISVEIRNGINACLDTLLRVEVPHIAHAKGIFQ